MRRQARAWPGSEKCPDPAAGPVRTRAAPSATTLLLLVGCRSELALAGQPEVPLLDLLPALRELHARDGTELFHAQRHHTGAASAGLAEAILAFLPAH